MGKAFSRAKNPFKNFNVESRAHKVISQNKPQVAPRHKKDQIEYERILKEYPDVLEENLKKNTVLDKHLRDVYVVSHDDPKENVKQEPNPKRPLPTDRSQVQPFLYGVKDPEKVSLGKITLANALDFIAQHQNDPVINNSTKISEKFNLAEDRVKNILKFFRVFEVYVPVERQTKATFVGPSVPKRKIVNRTKKELPSPSSDDPKT